MRGRAPRERSDPALGGTSQCRRPATRARGGRKVSRLRGRSSIIVVSTRLVMRVPHAPAIARPGRIRQVSRKCAHDPEHVELNLTPRTISAAASPLSRPGTPGRHRRCPRLLLQPRRETHLSPPARPSGPDGHRARVLRHTPRGRPKYRAGWCPPCGAGEAMDHTKSRDGRAVSIRASASSPPGGRSRAQAPPGTKPPTRPRLGQSPGNVGDSWSPAAGRSNLKTR